MGEVEKVVGADCPVGMSMNSFHDGRLRQSRARDVPIHGPIAHQFDHLGKL